LQYTVGVGNEGVVKKEIDVAKKKKKLLLEN
jgi:hypothetical protein